MYKVLKDKGNNSNVTLLNLETSSSIIIGKLTMSILEILEREGHSFTDEEKTVTLTDEWDFEISDEGAKELARKAMPMKKPVRDQRKKSEQAPEKDNKKIDAMDVLLGLANYN